MWDEKSEESVVPEGEHRPGMGTPTSLFRNPRGTGTPYSKASSWVDAFADSIE